MSAQDSPATAPLPLQSTAPDAGPPVPAQAATSPAPSDGIAAAFALLNPQPDPSTVAAQSDAATAADPAQVEAARTELATARTEVDKLKAERRELELRKQLDGKVSDVEAALKLLDPKLVI